jgi:hypothetical protein
MNFLQIQTIIALNFISISITKRYNLNHKLHTVKPCGFTSAGTVGTGAVIWDVPRQSKSARDRGVL